MNSMTTQGNAITTPILAIFKANDDLMARALDGLTASEAGRRLTDKNNPMLWLAGHVAQTRSSLLRMFAGNL